jgi:hypothetical protein
MELAEGFVRTPGLRLTRGPAVRFTPAARTRLERHAFLWFLATPAARNHWRWLLLLLLRC